MKIRWLIRIGILLMLSSSILLIAPESRYLLVGLFRNEPYYDHMPASYWKDQMRAWTAKDPKPPPAAITRLLQLAGIGSRPSRPRVLDGGKEAVPVLIELVKEEKLWIRILAIRSLGRIGPEAREAVPSLIAVLGDGRIFDDYDDPENPVFMDWWCGPVYHEAAAALGAIGPEAKTAVPELIKMRRTDGGNDYTSSTIDYALKRIDPVAAAQAGIR